VQILFRLLLALMLVAALPAEGKGRSGGKSGGKPHPHHHHPRSGVSVGALFLLPPLLFYNSPAYVYSPPYPGARPSRFIEQAPEGPPPGTTERFLCPDSWLEYPDVVECPGGWARIIDLGEPL
jgi:hypothetical protein